MKTSILSFVLFLVPFSAATAEERAGESVEVELQRLFIPSVGYDDNDRVEVVLQGMLPHPCYTLTDTEIEKVSPQLDKRVYRVRQMGWRRLDGACAGKLPHLPIPFQVTAALGRIAAGDYQVWFHGCHGEPQAKLFTVEEARGSHVDNYYYVKVSAIRAEANYRRGEPVRITVEGTIPSTCLELEHGVEATLLDDTVLILPQLITNLEDCHPIERPITATFTVPAPRDGHYLVHARTYGGGAVYHPFRVGP